MAEAKRQDEVREVILESGIRVKPVYTHEDIQDIDVERDIGLPGEYPFTRGIHPLMYRQRPWTMRQYSGFGTALDANKRWKYLLERGQNALNVAFDLPTQMGLDSDDPQAEGEVGRLGMAIDTLRDMEDAFAGIPLDRISTSLTINAPAAILVAMYVVVAEKQGIPYDRISGTAQNDILKEHIGRGAWIFPVEPSMRLIGDVMEYCARHLPRYNPVSVCGYHIRESGATPAQEMAYGFAIAMAYIDEVLRRGLPIDAFAPRISFNFDVFGNLFEQVAKFRAGRRLWAKLLKEKYGAQNPRSMWMRMIAGGGGAGLTMQEPENNIVRAAYYAMAAALSGAQTMALCSYDEAYTIPSAKAAKISLRTMQILAEEVGLTDTVDPLAGSYYVEALTAQMEEKIREQLQRIEDMGGIVKAVTEGIVQKELAHQAYLEKKKIETGELVKVGVNKYVDPDAAPTSYEEGVDLHQYTQAQVDEQIRRLREVKAQRDNAVVTRHLERLRDAAKSDVNLMPYILEAVRAYASVGEITGVLKEVFGVFREPRL